MAGFGRERKSVRLGGLVSENPHSAAAELRSYVWQRYDRRSLWALGALVLTGGVVGYRWSDLLDANGTMDWLLTGIWVGMAALSSDTPSKQATSRRPTSRMSAARA